MNVEICEMCRPDTYVVHPQIKEGSIYRNSNYRSNGHFASMARNSCNKKLEHIPFLKRKIGI
jgi:hypothetical protein